MKTDQIEQQWYDFLRYSSAKFPHEAMREYRDVFYAGFRAALQFNSENEPDAWQRCVVAAWNKVDDEAQPFSDFERKKMRYIFMGGGKALFLLLDEIEKDSAHKHERRQAIGDEFNDYVARRKRQSYRHISTRRKSRRRR